MAADTRINERYTTGATPQKNAEFRAHFGHKRPDLSAGGAALWSHENDPLLLKSLSLRHCPCSLNFRLFSIESTVRDGSLSGVPTRRDLMVQRHKFMRQTTNS